MKGYARIPTTHDLHQAYLRLEKGSLKSTDIVELSQLVRFDPRLGELLVNYLVHAWQSYSPQEINALLKVTPWPASLGVCLEMISLHSQFNLSEKKLFANWKACAMTGVARAHFEQFYIGIHSFAGKLARQTAEKPSRPYKIWGYLESQPMINKFKGQGRTLLNADQREQRLRSLLKVQSRITTQDYIAACDCLVSVRQAQLDLQSNPRLRALGTSKGRYYLSK